MAEPSLPDLARQIAETQASINLAWTLTAGFLVMFMQAGFALVESGLTRAKNVAHTMAMNLLVYGISILGFWTVGFGLQMGGMGQLTTLGGEAGPDHELIIQLFGKDFGLLGLEGFFLSSSSFAAPVAAIFLFQAMFMATASTIPTGALLERWKFHAFVLFSFAVSSVIYPVYANWVWGGGWLSTLGRNFQLGHGHVDFAGSSCVHMTGGVIAFALARRIGPRHGKYERDGRARAIAGHNVAYVCLGTFILTFGWFGFNAGSTLAATDARIAVVAANTMLASAAGAFGAYLYTTWRFGKPDISMMCNGMLAGMVAITAPCAFVDAAAAVFVGFTAGVLVVASSMFVEHRLKVDDPVGASSVHGVCGLWGVIALGLFANGTYGEGLNGVSGPVRGLFHGDGGQLVAQLLGAVTNVLYVAPMALGAFALIGKIVPNRASMEDEIDGLDVPELGNPGYIADEEDVAYEIVLTEPTTKHQPILIPR